jgi:hypothetical protein
VPNQQKAIFTVDNQKIIDVVQRLSSTWGGAALLMKGPIPKGTLSEMLFGTVFGKVNAHIEFLHRGADGVPLAQAFTFIMDATNRQRLQKALEEMNTSDFSDTTVKAGFLNVAFDSLRQSIRRLSGMLNSKQKTRS